MTSLDIGLNIDLQDLGDGQLTDLLDLLYFVSGMEHGEEDLIRGSSGTGRFVVKSFNGVMEGRREVCFLWKAIWKVRASKVAFLA